MVDSAVPGTALTPTMWLVPAPLAEGAVHLVVSGDDQITVVDTGYGAHVATVISPHLAARHRRLNDVDQIVTTHVHLDHAGGHAALLRDATVQNTKRRTRIAVHRADAAAPTDATAFTNSRWELATTLDALGQHGLAGGRRTLVAEHWSGPFPVDQLLEDGDELLIGGQPAVVVHSPGHTPGSVSLFLHDHGIAIVGDAVQRWGVGANGWPLVTDPLAYLDSLDRIAALAPQVMVMAHPFRGGTGGAGPICRDAQVGEALRDSRRFVETALDVARGHARQRSVDEATRSVITRVDAALGRSTVSYGPFAWATAYACLAAMSDRS